MMVHRIHRGSRWIQVDTGGYRLVWYRMGLYRTLRVCKGNLQKRYDGDSGVEHGVHARSFAVRVIGNMEILPIHMYSCAGS